MNRTLVVLLAALAVFACGFSAWQLSLNAISSIQQSFADEQTSIFSEMVSRSSEALHKTPPNVESAIGCLEYTHSYYPSGTKQTTGTFLDSIVERARTNAEQRILEMLRNTNDIDASEFPNWVAQD